MKKINEIIPICVIACCGISAVRAGVTSVMIPPHTPQTYTASIANVTESPINYKMMGIKGAYVTGQIGALALVDVTGSFYPGAIQIKINNSKGEHWCSVECTEINCRVIDGHCNA